MENIELLVSDETLRDGEQQAGIFFDLKIKQTLANLIANTGVHQIAIMPAIHHTEAELFSNLVTQKLDQRLAASTMMSRCQINYSQSCGAKQIILFNAVSDRLLFLRDSQINRDPIYRHQTIDDDIPQEVINQIRQNAIAKILSHLQYAKKKGFQVCFAAEDASRADFDFLVDCINIFKPYISQFLLCDTLGILTPEKTYIWIRDLLECTNHAPLGVHFHNDLGLALENTIQGVIAGASGISGTFGGIGERAGNVPLEKVLLGLKMRKGWEVRGINYEALTLVTDYLDSLGIQAYPPYSCQSQRYETGIHVHSMLRDRSSYSIFPHIEPEIWFGKCSGASNFKYLFEHYLKQPLSKKHYERLRSQIKTLAVTEQRSFSTQEVLELLAQKKLTIDERKAIYLKFSDVSLPQEQLGVSVSSG
ncbi:MAG: 2-isopropylmalate synthase [Xenococcaceae cyanobacterium MO_188.B19]|nr:2-isopropylmalate synthase [Xenococcaceae cyanobacterium MO_188.B19]